MKTFTVKQIAKKLMEIDDESDSFIQMCRQDERKGVQRLIEKWEKEKRKQKRAYIKYLEMKKTEDKLKKQGFRYIAGIDEVGRGPLAGPVVAAAVILPDDFCLLGLDDSKKLTEKERIKMYIHIRENAIAIGTGIIAEEEIDSFNIYEATKKAMLSAIVALKPSPDYLLIDAMKLVTPIPQSSLVKGDSKSISIAAASIIAKVTRDKIMKKYSLQFPQYHFARNMGYGTKDHIAAIKKYGPCRIHRRSFSPVKEMTENISKQ